MSLHTLLDLHAWKRPHGSRSERLFIRQYLSELPNAVQDPIGNVHVSIGDDPWILFSCHTDTVASEGGKQSLHLSGDGILTAVGKRSTLGADDTAGVYLLREMIAAGIPGHYCFHRAEELGCLGSNWLAETRPTWVRTFDAAIAFDRRGTTDIITHQGGSRTCSDQFALGLADVLNDYPSLAYTPSPLGIFTDTISYAGLIPECTNVSVGYSGEHGSAESLNVSHLLKLRESLLGVNWESIHDDCVRDPRTWDDGIYAGPINMGKWEFR